MPIQNSSVGTAELTFKAKGAVSPGKVGGVRQWSALV